MRIEICPVCDAKVKHEDLECRACRTTWTFEGALVKYGPGRDDRKRLTKNEMREKYGDKEDI